MDKLGLKVDKYLSWKSFAALIKAARAKDPSIIGY